MTSGTTEIDRTRGERGATLLEVLVAIGIFGVTSMCVAKAFVFHLSTNTVSEQKTAAYQAAQQRLDRVRVDDPGNLPNSGSTTETITIGTRPFSVRTSYCLKSSYCTTNTKHLEVRVSYKGRELYAVETVYAQLR
jgi:type II secretory pathway pseudopilin PulG